jgi:hypothetical protein
MPGTSISDSHLIHEAAQVRRSQKISAIPLPLRSKCAKVLDASKIKAHNADEFSRGWEAAFFVIPAKAGHAVKRWRCPVLSTVSGWRIKSGMTVRARFASPSIGTSIRTDRCD